MSRRYQSGEWKYHEQELFFHTPFQEISILGYPNYEFPITTPEKCDRCQGPFFATAFDLVIYDGPQFYFTREIWICENCVGDFIHPLPSLLKPLE